MLTTSIASQPLFLEKFLLDDCCELNLIAVKISDRPIKLMYFLTAHLWLDRRAFLLETYNPNSTCTESGILSGFAPYIQHIEENPFFIYNNNIIYDYNDKIIGIRMSNGYFNNLFLPNIFYEIKAPKDFVNFLFRPEFQEFKEGTIYKKLNTIE